MKRPFHPVNHMAIYALVALAALYISLRTVLLLHHNDPDTSHSLLLWQGVSEHGVAWLRDWLFTPDNWLLSVIPLHFLAFFLLGPDPSLPVVSGWVIMTVAALVSGWIARQAGAPNTALVLPIILLLLNVYAHQRGFVSYSMSHNITNLFGLMAISLLLWWASKPALGRLLTIGLMLTAGAVSDPWMLAAYNLPIAMVCLVFWLPGFTVIRRRDSLKLLAVAVFSIIASKSLLFGLLDFVPGLEFRLGDWATLRHNSVYWLKDLGGLLNLVPWQTGNALLPWALSLLVTTGLVFFLGLKAAHSGKAAVSDQPFSILTAISFFSVSGISLAFIITDVKASDHSARFLINILYLLPLWLGILLERQWPQLSTFVKTVSIGVPGLFLTANLSSHALLWVERHSVNPGQHIHDMSHFLQQHGLNYGYGPYWGSHANAVTVATQGKVTIRPITFDKASGKALFGKRFQSSMRWYTAEDAPPQQQEFFIAVSPDDEECLDKAVCIQGLTRQFGEPTRTLTYKTATILVWNHPLIGFQPPLSPIPATLGQTLHFTRQHQLLPDTNGWSMAEDWGTWTEGESASLLLQLQAIPPHDLLLTIEAHAFLGDKLPSRQIEVSVNTEKLASLQFDQKNNHGSRTISLPKALLLNHDGQLLIGFHIQNPQSPAELGISADTRRLGLALTALTLTTPQGSP